MPREAPPGTDGKPRYWVEPKDVSGIFPAEPPDVFSMAPPRGAATIETMHAPPTELLTPMERREALVFDKCHERARLALGVKGAEFGDEPPVGDRGGGVTVAGGVARHSGQLSIARPLQPQKRSDDISDGEFVKIRFNQNRREKATTRRV